jgi:hypothetical protein
MDSGLGLLAFQPPRRNGFEKPLEVSQVASWILFTLFALTFIFFSAPAFGLAVGLGLLLPYIMLCIFVFITGWLATAIDTTDPHLLERSVKKDDMTDEIALKMRRTMPPNVEWWYVLRKSFVFRSFSKFFGYSFNCKWYVSKNSYHCRRCNKCSRGLDHHCAFLNNCIAEKNYSMFMACTLSAVILLAYQLVIDLTLLTIAFIDWESIEQNLIYFYGSFPEILFKVVMIVISLLLIGSLIMIGHLLVFHIFLYFRGQLTHEFLMGEQSVSQSHLSNSSSSHHKSSKVKKSMYCACMDYSSPKKNENDRELKSDRDLSVSERSAVRGDSIHQDEAVVQGSSMAEMQGVAFPG